MPTTTIKNVHLKVSLGGGADYACQITTAGLTFPGYSEGETIEVACPEGVVVGEGQPESGELTFNSFTDTSDGGLTWTLMQARMSGAVLEYEVQWFADLDETQSFTMTGQAKVAQFTLPWEKPALSRHDSTLILKTGVLARPAPA